MHLNGPFVIFNLGDETVLTAVTRNMTFFEDARAPSRPTFGSAVCRLSQSRCSFGRLSQGSRRLSIRAKTQNGRHNATYEQQNFFIQCLSPQEAVLRMSVLTLVNRSQRVTSHDVGCGDLFLKASAAATVQAAWRSFHPQSFASCSTARSLSGISISRTSGVPL